jgi:hypothetical protein
MLRSSLVVVRVSDCDSDYRDMNVSTYDVYRSCYYFYLNTYFYEVAVGMVPVERALTSRAPTYSTLLYSTLLYSTLLYSRQR